MKKFGVRLALFAIVAMVAATLPAQAADWEKLGRTTLVFNDENGAIKIKDDMACNQIMFKVAGKWIEIDTVTLHFTDGSSQEVELGASIEPGQESEPIAIDGGAKSLEKVEFAYKPVDRQWTGRTNVTLLGA